MKHRKSASFDAIDDGVGGCGYVAGCACEYRLFVEFYTIVVLDLACVVLVLDKVKRKTKLYSNLQPGPKKAPWGSSADNEIIRHTHRRSNPSRHFYLYEYLSCHYP